jgi:hypothetical protein
MWLRPICPKLECNTLMCCNYKLFLTHCIWVCSAVRGAAAVQVKPAPAALSEKEKGKQPKSSRSKNGVRQNFVRNHMKVCRSHGALHSELQHNFKPSVLLDKPDSQCTHVFLLYSIFFFLFESLVYLYFEIVLLAKAPCPWPKRSRNVEFYLTSKSDPGEEGLQGPAGSQKKFCSKHGRKRPAYSKKRFPRSQPR